MQDKIITIACAKNLILVEVGGGHTGKFIEGNTSLATCIRSTHTEHGVITLFKFAQYLPQQT